MACHAPQVDRKICIGLVGCGRVSGKHFEALEAPAEVVELVAVCDTDPDALAAAESRTGVPGFSSVATFSPPDNPAHVSFTMLPRDGEDQITAPVHRLSTIAERLGHDRSDVLKMDIEGAEYEVLPDCVANGPPIHQLLVEFHHWWADVPIERTREAVRLLNSNSFKVIYISPTGTEYSFLHD